MRYFDTDGPLLGALFEPRAEQQAAPRDEPLLLEDLVGGCVEFELTSDDQLAFG